MDRYVVNLPPTIETTPEALSSMRCSRETAEGFSTLPAATSGRTPDHVDTTSSGASLAVGKTAFADRRR